MSTAILSSVQQLEAYLAQHQLQLSPQEQNALQNNPFPLRLPVHYAKLIRWDDPQDPLKRIAIPQIEEQTTHPYELSDPIGDHAREAVPGLIHRYPNRALLLLTTYCHIHCRFCFRREVVGKQRQADILKIRDYLQSHPEIEEIIFSGGDPFTFPQAFVESLLKLLLPIPSIKIIRWHTRIPVVNPEAVTPEWLNTITQTDKQVVVVMHIDHPRELSAETLKLMSNMKQLGIMLLSQTVLLKGVNDSVATLTQLFTQLIQHGVKPYYFHHLDQAPGTHHYRLSIPAGLELVQKLRGHVSGIAMPLYVIDLPGGYGKIPVEELKPVGNHTYQATTFLGTVTYTDQA